MTNKKIWIARDYLRCSGCRKCEIACSLHKEGRIWPEASRIRVFMLVPGVEFPHLCVQCHDYACVKKCPVEALSIDDKTGAVLVNNEKCTGCGICIDACPGKIPHMHPNEKHIIICDLCGGEPQCVKICQEGGWGALWIVQRGVFARSSAMYTLYSRTPEEITEDLAINLFGEKGKELM